MTDTANHTTTDTTNHIHNPKTLDFQTDQYFVRKYVSRIFTRFYRYGDDARWSDLRGDDMFGSPLLGLPEELGHRFHCFWHGGLERVDVTPLRQFFLKLEEETSRQPCPEGLIRRNLRALARELRLPDEALEVLTFLLAMELYEPVKSLVGNHELSSSERTLLMAAATRLDPDEVQALLSRNSPLVAAKLLDFDGGRLSDVGIASPVLRAFTLPHLEPGDVLSWAVTRDRQAALPVEAFAHLKPWPEVAWRCLKAADAQGRGLNVLLHGPGGAGKTALSRSLCTSARLELFGPPRDLNPGPCISYTTYLQAFAVLRRRGHGALLMDPGILASPHKPSFGQLDQLFLMDHPGVQVLWTAPSPDALHPAWLHRFDLVLALPAPAEPWTRPVWEDLLTPDERTNLELR